MAKKRTRIESSREESVEERVALRLPIAVPLVPELPVPKAEKPAKTSAKSPGKAAPTVGAAPPGRPRATAPAHATDSFYQVLLTITLRGTVNGEDVAAAGADIRAVTLDGKPYQKAGPAEDLAMNALVKEVLEKLRLGYPFQPSITLSIDDTGDLTPTISG